MKTFRQRHVGAFPFAIAAVATAMLSALAGCTGGAADEATLDRIQRQGFARVGYANEAPYAYLDSATGEVRGEAPVIARRVLADLGVERIEGVLTEFGSLIPGLKARRFDLIAAGMYVKPQRCREIAFSEPTYGIGEAFVVAEGNPLDLHGYDDVAAHPEARLGVVAGAVQLAYARQTGVDDDRVLLFPDAPSAVAGVQAGRVDAYAGTRLTVRDLLSKAGDAGLERAEPFRDPVIDGQTVRGYGAFGFRLEDDAFRQAFNDQLAAFLGTPGHLHAVRPFGFTADDLPGAVTTAELCAGAVAGDGNVEVDGDPPAPLETAEG